MNNTIVIICVLFFIFTLIVLKHMDVDYKNKDLIPNKTFIVIQKDHSNNYKVITMDRKNKLIFKSEKNLNIDDTIQLDIKLKK